jgi:hypothetical protein
VEEAWNGSIMESSEQDSLQYAVAGPATDTAAQPLTDANGRPLSRIGVRPTSTRALSPEATPPTADGVVAGAQTELNIVSPASLARLERVADPGWRLGSAAGAGAGAGATVATAPTASLETDIFDSMGVSGASTGAGGGVTDSDSDDGYLPSSKRHPRRARRGGKKRRSQRKPGKAKSSSGSKSKSALASRPAWGAVHTPGPSCPVGLAHNKMLAAFPSRVRHGVGAADRGAGTGAGAGTHRSRPSVRAKTELPAGTMKSASFPELSELEIHIRRSAASTTPFSPSHANPNAHAHLQLLAPFSPLFLSPVYIHV